MLRLVLFGIAATDRRRPADDRARKINLLTNGRRTKL
jgi:hypothetical protein